MFLTLGVSLYTSRVVLNVLGVEDFGLYNVIGGVVAMLSFMNSALSGATSRFLSYELGKGNDDSLKNTFSTILGIHVIFAFLVVIILELVGFWFVTNKLIIPNDRLNVALCVFHFSVAACAVNLLRLPFYAAIISHERMDVFAYISVFNVVMKLIIVYLLQLIEYDKLVMYSILIFTVELLSSVLNVVFAKCKFVECQFNIKVRKEIAKPILTFSGWDLYGNLSVVVRGHGLNVLQNTFFGTVVNAATGISNQVLSAIMGFAENFMVAVKPQIVKSFAANDLTRFESLVINSSKYCTLLLFFISFPFLLETDFILSIWLVEPPNYAVVFCQLAIVNNWISIMFRPIVYGVHATGNAKRISIINGTIYLSVLPVSYILLKMGGSPLVPFVLNIILLFVGQISFSLTTLKRYVPEFRIGLFIKKSMIKCTCIGGLSSVIPLYIRFHMDVGWNRFFLCSICAVFITVFLVYFIGLEKLDREKLLLYLKKKIRKKV